MHLTKTDTNRIETWHGTKLSEVKVRYTNNTAQVLHEQWPPADNTRVHSLDVSTRAKKRATRGLRAIPECPSSLVEADLDAVLEMLKGFSTREWVEWCDASPCRRTLPHSHWRLWSNVVKNYLGRALREVSQSNFAERALLFLAIPQLFLARGLRNETLKETLMRQKAFVRSEGSVRKPGSGSSTDAERAARRAQNLAEQGFLSKAVKALCRNKVLQPKQSCSYSKALREASGGILPMWHSQCLSPSLSGCDDA